MQSKQTKKSSKCSNYQLSQSDSQLSIPDQQFFELTSQHQSNQRKMDLQLYLHFQLMLFKSQTHYDQQSPFFNKKPSKQKITNEVIKYLTQFKQYIYTQNPQHFQQLLFLIDQFNTKNELITNCYCLNQDFIIEDCLGRFGLSIFFVYNVVGFGFVRERVDVGKLIRFNNWNHLLELSFYDSGWFNDDDWSELVKHADHFQNIRELTLTGNNINTIKEGDIQHFNSLIWVDLKDNPLSQQSISVLNRLNQKNRQIRVHFIKR